MTPVIPRKPKELRVSDWLRTKRLPSAPAPAPAPDGHSPTAATATAAQRGPVPSATINRPKPYIPAIKAGPVEPSRLLDGFSSASVPIPLDHSSSSASVPHDEGYTRPLPIDPFRLIGGLIQRKRAIVLAGVLGLLAGFLAGYSRGDTYESSMVLLFRDLPRSVPVESGRAYQPKEFNKPTLTEILMSDALLERVAPKLTPPTTAKKATHFLKFDQSRGADFVKLVYKGAPSAELAVQNLNVWSQEALSFTRELQSRESEGTRKYLQRQSLQGSLNEARNSLTQLRAQYSDANPLIREKLAQIEWLEKRMNGEDGETPAPEAAAPRLPSRDELGYFSVMSPPTVDASKCKSRWFKGGVAGAAGFFGLMFLGVCISLGSELVDRKVRTARELELAVGVPNIQRVPRIVPTSLGLQEISSLWTRIVGASPRELVCFWSPWPDEQTDLLLQSLLHLASKQAAPLLWVDTGTEFSPPPDFKQIELEELEKHLAPGRYYLKLDINSLLTAEAEEVGKALGEIADRHRIPVWLGLEGEIVEPGPALARHAHRVKILASLEAAEKEFWQTQAELLHQSVNTPIEWLAVNHVPWYRWSSHGANHYSHSRNGGFGVG